jgi:hypothetical protein
LNKPKKFPVSEALEAVAFEINEEYMDGAIAWVDKNFNNGWSNTINQFESEVVEAWKKNDEAALNRACNTYKLNLINYARMYKESQKIDEVQIFLSYLDHKAPKQEAFNFDEGSRCKHGRKKTL